MNRFRLSSVLICAATILATIACHGSSSVAPTDPSNKYGEYSLREISPGVAKANVWHGYEILRGEFAQGVLKAEISFAPTSLPDPYAARMILTIMEERHDVPRERCDVILLAGPDRCLVILARNDSLDNPKSVHVETNGLIPSKYIEYKPDMDVTVSGMISFIGMRK